MVKTINVNIKVLDVDINPKEDMALIIYSSGTTGLPKGVVHTHYTLVAIVTVTSHPCIDFLDKDEDVYFQTAPPFHIAGLMIISSHFFAKKTLVLYTAPSVIPYLLKAKQYKVKYLNMLPNLLIELSKMSLEEIKSLGIDFSDMVFFTGGSVFNAVNTDEILSKTGVKAIIQGYGSTEAGLVTIDNVVDFVPGSAGKVAPNVDFKVEDLISGKALGPHERGEICVKAPFVTKGYHNNPEATKQAIDSDGWCHMGDLGYYDDTEHIFIVDRLKDVIKYQTMQVAPAEIEEVIYTHPAIKTVCVVGVDHDSAGEVPLACVVVKDRHTVSEEEITKLVADNLADYKRLRGGVKFMNEFPITSIGKIKRKELKDMIKEELKLQVE